MIIFLMKKSGYMYQNYRISCPLLSFLSVPVVYCTLSTEPVAIVAAAALAGLEERPFCLCLWSVAITKATESPGAVPASVGIFLKKKVEKIFILSFKTIADVWNHLL